MKKFFTRGNLKKRIILSISILSWIVLLTIGLYEQHYHLLNKDLFYLTFFIKGLALNGFIVSTYYFTLINKIIYKEINFFFLLWKVFIFALACTFLSSIVTVLLYLIDHFSPFSDNLLLHTFLFHVEFGLFIVFLTVAFISWKEMILYKKTKFVYYTWRVFEISISIMLLFHFFLIKNLDLFNIWYLLILIIIILLCINLKWIPQLTVNQRLAGLIYSLGILICLAYFLIQITDYFSKEPLVVDDLSKSFFSATLCIFIASYLIACFIGMCINFKSTLSYKNRSQQTISNFQSFGRALGKSLIEGKNSKNVFKILLNNVMSLVNAESGWLEIFNEEKFYVTKNINEDEIAKIKRKELYIESKKNLNSKLYKPLKIIEKSHYQSIIIRNIYSGKQNIGELVLLKKSNASFGSIMEESVSNFILQTDMVMNNFKLLSDTVKNEHYKEELKLAKKIHDNLFPINEIHDEHLEIFAYSEAAKEIGGDYYDFYKTPEGKYAMVIADISGNGMEGAFNMAQMKGIFQVLVRFHLSPTEFLYRANNALVNSIEKKSFITAIYFQIDTHKQIISFSRAGHCPILYYNSKEKKISFLELDGLGLGIIKGDKYKNFIKIYNLTYHVGDMLFLYTDGLIEASKLGDQDHYGYERLKASFQTYHNLSLKDISKNLLDNINKFTKRKHIEDDFTVLLIKFI